jgi:hypothetical protein
MYRVGLMRMKKFFKKIGAWFVRHKPSKRKLVQLYAALLVNANIKGFFNDFYHLWYLLYCKIYC